MLQRSAGAPAFGLRALQRRCSMTATRKIGGSSMEKIIRRIDLKAVRGDDARQLPGQEWLVTNGLGGYASSTIAGAVTWRYHGLLIAALPAPLGRVVMLNHLAEHLR